MDFSEEVWSCAFWHVLHIISFNYAVCPTLEQQQNYKLFLRSLTHVLPNKAFRERFGRTLSQTFHSRDLVSRHAFARYVFFLHTMLGAPVKNTFERLRVFYEMFRSKCGENGCVRQNNFVPSRILLRVRPEKSRANALQVKTSCFIKTEKQQNTLQNEHNDLDFESNDGFSTKIWGCPLWHLLHLISFAVPQEPSAVEQQQLALFLQSLSHVLPCRLCRDNFQLALCRSNLALHSQDAFARYVFQLHNSVPKRPRLPLTFEQLRQVYQNLRKGSRLLLHIVPEAEHQFTRSFRVHETCLPM